MGLITVVRHGQASTFAKEYDRLTPTGHEQARQLGEYWADNGIRWDRVLVGPRLRHRQTEEEVAAIFRARGLPWPAAEHFDWLDELDMARVILHLEEQGFNDTERALNMHSVPEGERPQAMKAMFRYMVMVMKEFAGGRIPVPEGAETWKGVQQRAKHALDFMAQSGKSQRVVAFSSGGFTGILVGSVLDLSDAKTIELMMRVRNGSYTSFVYSPESITLNSFNSVPHLAPKLWTLG
ncbi:MAG: histidine phosphatase family protein [Steroidobacteraceae bacterium]